MTAKDLWVIASPFVAALLASWLTYFFSVRGKRYDLAQAERLAAFRVLKERLLALKRYCEARAADIDGGDFELRSEDLPAETRRSFLEYHQELSRLLDEYSHILPGDSREALREATDKLGLVCSMLTMSLSVPREAEAAADLYRSTAEQATHSVERLYETLKLPR